MKQCKAGHFPCRWSGLPFYDKLGLKYADDVMQHNHIEWTEWTVE